MTEKYNHFLCKQNSKFWFGASFFDCVLWEMFSLNHLLACLFFPSAIPTAALYNLQAAKLKQKVHPFGQIQKGNCCQILCLDVLCPNIFVVKSFFGQTLQSDNEKSSTTTAFPIKRLLLNSAPFQDEYGLKIFSFCFFFSELQDCSNLIESIFALVENVIYFCSRKKKKRGSNYCRIKSRAFVRINTLYKVSGDLE